MAPHENGRETLQASIANLNRTAAKISDWPGLMRTIADVAKSIWLPPATVESINADTR